MTGFVKVTVIALLTASLILFLVFWHTPKLSESKDFPVGGQEIYLDIFAKSISIELEIEENDYMCLSSAEYGQAYLPSPFECNTCIMSVESRETIERPWSSDRILLISKKGAFIKAREIDLSRVAGIGVRTWYGGISYHPEIVTDMAQCTTDSTAVASCFDYSGECLFLFESRQNVEGMNDE